MGLAAWIAAVALLLGYEFWALATGRQTLSRAVWNATLAWPPVPFVGGLVAGGLAVHFWWHWCP